MKKSIIKNLIALTFALGALVFVAGNVFGGENPNEDDCDELVSIGGVDYPNQAMGYCGGGSMVFCCTAKPRPYSCKRGSCNC